MTGYQVLGRPRPALGTRRLRLVGILPRRGGKVFSRSPIMPLRAPAADIYCAVLSGQTQKRNGEVTWHNA